MASTVVVKRSDLYPAGTTVKLFVLPNNARAELTQQHGDPEAWVPALLKQTSAVVSAQGTLSFAGLVGGGQYYAWANVGGEDRYLRVMAPTSPALGTGEAWAEWEEATAGVCTVSVAAVPNRRRVVTAISGFLICTGATAAVKRIKVTLKSGVRTVWEGTLVQPKVTEAGAKDEFALSGLQLPGEIGAAMTLEAQAGEANVVVQLNMAGYTE